MGSEILEVTGRAVPLVGNDIDTDRIIPARFLRSVTFDGLGANVFIDDRQQLQGQHPFDQAQYQGATVLVVNRNFGCGSSREHAPQAIAKWGIQAIVGESFAEIFFGNCLSLGIPCVTAGAVAVAELQAAIASDPSQPVTVDLEQLQVRRGAWSAELTLAPGPLQMLRSGQWDATGQLVANAEAIAQTAANLPYVGWQAIAAS
ncbi:3-isopropylmalate dehydratase small subunit [Synechococcus elongatus]|uniref:3-isopropylmalate dehydratase small subunit n=1 Tax=Synechococcus elongatus TaxID=32046 RepID=UPI000F7DF418|nr:3-isopropylmalate dehydratase small subunit [Synechococcus elongatus]